jgi:hypothetical protein
MTFDLTKSAQDIRLQRKLWHRVAEAIRTFEMIARDRGWDIRVAATVVPRNEEEPDEAA